MRQPLVADSFWDDLIRKDSEVNRNIFGNWTRTELRQSAAVFNSSRDPAERKRELTRFFCSNYILKVQIGESAYVPERFPDREKLFQRECIKSALHLLTRLEGRAMILGDKIVAYNPLVAVPCLENSGVFSWERASEIPLEIVEKIILRRVLEVPLATIAKIVLRRDRLLFIQL